ncbi:MAG: PAS domain S-box protein [Planctomycetaceae bacterium]
MTVSGPRSSSPFHDLKQVLAKLKSLVEESLTGDDARATAIALFGQLDIWIARAAQRKRRSDSVIEAALDAVIAIDPAGRVVEWNREAERVFGWSESKVLGRNVSDLIIPPRYRAAHAKGLSRFLSTGTGPVVNRRTELVALRRDGTEFPVELTVLTPLELDGQLVVYAFLRDISDRRRSWPFEDRRLCITRWSTACRST